MLLDLGLRDVDGLEVASQVRMRHTLPIIRLSARAEEEHQIHALDRGLNNYVTKLFPEGELMARVRAALRPASVIRHRREFVIGNLRIDATQRRVFVATTEVSLTPTEFKLLHTLARHADEVVTHSQLLQEVWGFGLVSELQYLRVYIKQLRHKTEVDPTRPQRIVTSLGVGYRLVMPEATPQTQRH